MTKRLVLSFDGTWNTPEHQDHGDDAPTNVWKMHRSVRQFGADGVRQLVQYFKGVGTNWYEKVGGGAFGLGLDKKILDGYKFLIRNYDEGHEIYLFGFSRGAYTARSLVGLIRKCGLLYYDPSSRDQYDELVEQAYKIYRTRDKAPDSKEAVALRGQYARDVSIKFIGVWDTVGALGIPIDSFDWFNRKFFAFHDTRLSGIVQNAFHAVAIDEHREAFKPALWTELDRSPGQNVEQRWFCRGA